MSLIPLLLACRPDPGAPDYPTREPFSVPGDDFYDLPLADGEERLSLGLFYEGEATETVVIDDTTAHFYIYENTFTDQVSDDRYEGFVADLLTHGSLAWWGGGVTWDVPRDLSGWEALHLVVKTWDLADWEIGVNGGGVEVRRPVGDYGLVADGAWHVLEVPLEDFDGADLSAVTVPLLMVGESGAAGDSLLLDAVFYTRGGGS